MGLKVGLKKTSIGYISKDWSIVKLGDVADFLKGKGLSKSQVSYYGSEKCIRYGELLTKYSEKISKVIGRTYSSNSWIRSKNNDVLMPTSAETPEALAVASAITEDNIVIGGDILIIRPLVHYLDSIFLSYQIRSQENQILQLVTGTTVYHIYASNMRNFEFFLPPLKEQRAIAQVLNDVDALMVALGKLIDKKKMIKKGMMQELLTGKNRLPGFNGEWSKKTLGELGDCIIGLTYSPSQIDDAGTLVLRSSNVQDGVLKFEDNVRVKANIPEKLMIKPNDILVCVRNGSRALIGKCALINESVLGMTFGAFMSIYRSEFGRFLFYQFQSDIIQEQINKNLGATINQITNKTMRSFEIDFSEDEDERNAITSILSDMDCEINALKAKLKKIKNIKKGMMQELLTGRIRLI